jgi:hypothetical protein
MFPIGLSGPSISLPSFNLLPHLQMGYVFLKRKCVNFLTYDSKMSTRPMGEVCSEDWTPLLLAPAIAKPSVALHSTQALSGPTTVQLTSSCTSLNNFNFIRNMFICLLCSYLGWHLGSLVGRWTHAVEAFWCLSDNSMFTTSYIPVILDGQFTILEYLTLK